MVFFQKHEKLEDTDNIRLWLIADSGGFDDTDESLLDILGPDERKLLELYYDSDYGQRNEAAKRLGLSLPALYRKIHKIKKKLRAAGKRSADAIMDKE